MPPSIILSLSQIRMKTICIKCWLRWKLWWQLFSLSTSIFCHVDTPMTWWLELSISHRFSASWRQSQGSKSLTRPIQPPQNGFTTLVIWNGKPKWFESGMVNDYFIDFWTKYLLTVFLPLTVFCIYLSTSGGSLLMLAWCNSSSLYFEFLLLSILYFFLVMFCILLSQYFVFLPLLGVVYFSAGGRLLLMLA